MDRGLVNPAWSQLFPLAVLGNLQFNHSDHHTMLVDTECYANLQQGSVKLPISFEARWLKKKKILWGSERGMGSSGS